MGGGGGGGGKKKFLLGGGGGGGLCSLNISAVNSYFVCLYCGLIANSK